MAGNGLLERKYAREEWDNGSGSCARCTGPGLSAGFFLQQKARAIPLLTRPVAAPVLYALTPNQPAPAPKGDASQRFFFFIRRFNLYPLRRRGKGKERELLSGGGGWRGTEANRAAKQQGRGASIACKNTQLGTAFAFPFLYFCKKGAYVRLAKRA
jgi:hypothetical protein